MALADQHAEFNDRISRIQKGGRNTTGRLVCGVTETRAPRSRADRRALARQERKLEQSLRRNANKAVRKPFLARLLVLPVALACGGAAMLGGRLALFHLFPEGAARFELPEPMVAVLTGGNGEFWAGAAMAVTLALCFRLLNPVRMMALFAGFAAMTIGETRLAEQYPDVWAAMYTPLPMAIAPASVESALTL